MLLRLPLLLILSLLLVLSSATTITSAALLVFYLLGLRLVLFAPPLVHYILRFGYTLGKDKSFTHSHSVWESIMLINHARNLAHMCFIPLRVGDVALILPLTL